MLKTKINYLLEYLSLILILSFLLVHNIILVLFGVFISLYLINIDFIQSVERYISNISSIQKQYRASDKQNTLTASLQANKNIAIEDSNLTLVETVEELGFIPSKNKRNTHKATCAFTSKISN